MVDVADERLAEKTRAVERLLGELELDAIPRLLVLNKADLLPAAEVAALAERFRGVAVSAARRRGLRRLIAAAEQALGDGRSLIRSYGEDPRAVSEPATS